MTGISMGVGHAIAAAFPWDRHQTVIDIGCAEGCVPVQVARAHGHISGGGFDLPAVAPLFDEYVAEAGLSDRLRFHAGDFFADQLPAADVLIMGHILHDWSAEEKRMLLEKAHAALPDGGALIVYEAIIDDDRRENAFGLLMSLNMLIETTAGFDYTAADCQGWMRDVGFSDSYARPLVGPDSMVVGIK
jgi:precorrin-6B methylase 2